MGQINAQKHLLIVSVFHMVVKQWEVRLIFLLYKHNNNKENSNQPDNSAVHLQNCLSLSCLNTTKNYRDSEKARAISGTPGASSGKALMSAWNLMAS